MACKTGVMLVLIILASIASSQACSCRSCRQYSSELERCRCCTFHMVGGKRSADFLYLPENTEDNKEGSVKRLAKDNLNFKDLSEFLDDVTQEISMGKNFDNKRTLAEDDIMAGSKPLDSRSADAMTKVKTSSPYFSKQGLGALDKMRSKYRFVLFNLFQS